MCDSVDGNRPTVQETEFNGKSEAQMGQISEESDAVNDDSVSINTRRQLIRDDRDSSQDNKFKVIMWIVLTLSLLNTAMSAWCVVSTQTGGSPAPETATRSHLPSAQSSIGGRLGQNQELLSVNRTLSNHETMLQNISKAIKLNAEAIASVEHNLAEILNTSLLTSGSVSNITNVCTNLATNSVTNYQNLLNAISAVTTPSGFVRLVDGPNRYSGRVEIYYEGVWGTICDDDWDIDDARVICRMLGYGGVSSAPGSAEYGRGYGSILLDDVQCSGTESSIVRCSKPSWHYNNCDHHEDASVVCA